MRPLPSPRRHRRRYNPALILELPIENGAGKDATMTVEVLYAPKLYRAPSHSKDISIAVVKYSDHLRMADSIDLALRNAFASSQSDDYALCKAMTEAARKAILDMMEEPRNKSSPASLRRKGSCLEDRGAVEKV